MRYTLEMGWPSTSPGEHPETVPIGPITFDLNNVLRAPRVNIGELTVYRRSREERRDGILFVLIFSMF